jgi:riboflavin kinase/FMN adenylyltransferase
VGEIAPDALIPHNGAYAVMVLLKSKWWQGMVNVGYRPTLSEGKRLSIEVNVFDFEGDVYGEPITLQFIQFLRLEFKMVSIDELRHQLELDRDKARAILKAYSQ